MTDDRWRDGYAAARQHYGTEAQATLRHLRERLLEMAAKPMPPTHRHQLEELAERAKRAMDR